MPPRQKASMTTLATSTMFAPSASPTRITRSRGSGTSLLATPSPPARQRRRVASTPGSGVWPPIRGRSASIVEPNAVEKTRTPSKIDLEQQGREKPASETHGTPEDPIQVDEEEDEVIRSLEHLEDVVEVPSPPTMNGKAWRRIAKPVITYPLAFLTFIYISAAIYYLGNQLMKRSQRTPQYPLSYVAWVVTSNAEHLQSLMQVVQPVDRFAETRVTEIEQVSQLADDLETIGAQAFLAKDLRIFALQYERMVEAALRMTSSSRVGFRSIENELRQADRLLKKLYPHRQDPTRLRNFPVEAQLSEAIEKFKRYRLPSILEAMMEGALKTTDPLNDLNTALRRVGEEFIKRDAEISRALGTMPPSDRSQRKKWEGDIAVAARKTRQEDVQGKFQLALEVESNVRSFVDALARYRSEVPLYDSLDVIAAHKQNSNGTFYSFMHRIDESLRRIAELHGRP